jgi:hypothetical protein
MEEDSWGKVTLEGVRKARKGKLGLLSVYTLGPLAGVVETPHHTMVNSLLWVVHFTVDNIHPP